MKRIMGAAAVVGLLVVGAVGCGPWGEQQRKTVSYEVPGQVDQLVVDGTSGGIDVKVGDGPVQVLEKRAWRDQEPQGSHELKDGVLKLTYSCSNCGIGYEVRVPAGTKLKLTQTSGGIQLHDVAGDVDAKVTSGGINTFGLKSKNVKLSVVSGGVEARFAEAPTRAEMSTDSGGLMVKVPAGEQYQVEAHADSGGTDVKVPSVVGAPHVLIARAVSGGVQVSNG
ncbi:DUF4097 family beta strand repeat-containing protein [Kitasatospora sp. CB01950]|uniref:DUF4097 family beta strand repeat-containing protein n=1 Tax=Kitasatospora sp. CB01950 TaxID=1703930 RepID=UPI00093BC58A|nr:DUF4097 family beta strand repeat-containing protein [Kitasatospora sp. CB01950]